MAVLGIFAFILLFMSIYHSKMLPTGGKSRDVHSLKEAFGAFGDVVKTFFKKKYILWEMAFVILLRSGEGQLVKIVPLFLKDARSAGGLESYF